MRAKDLGFLIIRWGIGIAFAFHGVYKLVEGPEALEELGGSLTGLIGVTAPGYYLGLLAALSQLISGLMISTGFKLVWGILIGIPSLIVAAIVLIAKGEPYSHYSHSLELIVVFIGLGLWQNQREKNHSLRN